jgi:lipopolysaccharide export system permease protein
MILQQALRRELAYTAGAVFLVMLTFMLTSLVIRILGMAANGKASPNDVLMLIGLATIGYLSILLSATLFISTLIVLTRWYKDSEMVVWFPSSCWRCCSACSPGPGPTSRAPCSATASSSAG